MAPNTAPGRVGTLTVEEERKLQETWLRLGTIADMIPEGIAGQKTNATVDGEDDKYSQSKEYQKFLDESTPKEIRDTIWSMAKMDHPDALILRFLRARKWNPERAVVMLVSTVQWRGEMGVEDNVVKVGELAALKSNPTPDDEGFMLQYRSGKSFTHGSDNQGRPIVVIKPKLHNPSKQSEKALQNYILHTVESLRICLKDPVDNASAIFDLTGFGLRNMDYAAVKFIIKVFEAHYPESLGQIAVHNAPWLFQGIWRIIKGWLDPVVASKIVFTNNTKDLLQLIPKENLLKEYGGDDKYEYQYVEPIQGENARLDDASSREKILAEREEIVKQFEEKTRYWVLADPAEEKGKQLMADRNALAAKLKDNYWKLDPFIRSRTILDRAGVLKEGGAADFNANRR